MSFGRTLGLVLGMALIARAASAADYQLLSGTLSGPDGSRDALTGHFQTGPLDQVDPDHRALRVHQFALQAGDRSFAPAEPISFNRLHPLFTIGDGIGLLGDSVDMIRLRTGGELVAANGDRATFHFLDFRADANDSGRAVGLLVDAPRRLQLAGTLYEVQETYEIRYLPCFDPSPIPPLTPIPPGPIDGGDITLRSGSQLEPATVVIVITPVANPSCVGLWPLTPAVEHPLGRFTLIATAARPIPIDVRPAQTDNVVIPGSPGHVPVAILAARPLHPCSLDDSSLRLGDGEAEPMPWSGREPTRERDVDGDGAPDLLARFRVRDTGIAFGDDSICLVAQTTCGYVLEGCDAIQTLR